MNFFVVYSINKLFDLENLIFLSLRSITSFQVFEDLSHENLSNTFFKTLYHRKNLGNAKSLSKIGLQFISWAILSEIVPTYNILCSTLEWILNIFYHYNLPLDFHPTRNIMFYNENTIKIFNTRVTRGMRVLYFDKTAGSTFLINNETRFPGFLESVFYPDIHAILFRKRIIFDKNIYEYSSYRNIFEICSFPKNSSGIEMKGLFRKTLTRVSLFVKKKCLLQF